MSSDSPGIRLPSAPAERIADNHVVYRRGNTRVHVQTYDAQQAEDIIKAKSNVFLKSGVSSFFSGILAMIIVVVTLVIKLSEAITTRITTNDVDTYMIMLYGICILWTLYYNVLSSLCGGVFSRIAKTNQSTNRWLKGVIIIFGTAIVLKDSMEFLSHTVDDSEECEAHYLSAVISALHLFFILNQSVFIFRYTKLFIPNNFLLPRTGIMFIIATNLSTWIESVVTETVVALNPSSAGHRSKAMVAVDTDSCSCHSSLCNTVHVAEKFMFPFLVEFSLVASCMLYVTWRNIGRLPPPYEGVVKPSYQLFGSYFGEYDTKLIVVCVLEQDT
nr:proton channel OTOP2-like [Ciona intestinalis]|eukprot:XP_026693290.1 proton channel OTOP2-like [Ciona intestinalis]